jgi:hypothetical protein
MTKIDGAYVETDNLFTHYVQIPHILLYKLNAYQFLLLAHYMRIAGARNASSIFESLRKTSDMLSPDRRCRFSHSKVVEVRQQLIDMGYLTVIREANAGKRQPMVLKVNAMAIWQQNYDEYVGKSADLEDMTPNTRAQQPVDNKKQAGIPGYQLVHPGYQHRAQAGIPGETNNKDNENNPVRPTDAARYSNGKTETNEQGLGREPDSADGTGKADSPQQETSQLPVKQKQSSAARPPKRVFNAVAQHLFGLDMDTITTEALSAMAGRIGKIVKVVLGGIKDGDTPQTEALAAKLPQFCAWYGRNYPDVNLPRDAAKFAEHWISYTNTAKASQNTPQPPAKTQEQAQRDNNALERYFMNQRSPLVAPANDDPIVKLGGDDPNLDDFDDDPFG